MKPARFTYHRPASVAEASQMLAALENARPLAGGQSLMPMMNLRYATPDHLVDLSRLAELSYIEASSPRICIGAMTRQRDLMADVDLMAACPIIAAALRHVGHIQTRNRGTIGGSLCHLDPAAELPGMMALLDATLTAKGKDGERTMAMADFPLGYMTPNLEPHEFLTAVEFDAPPKNHGWAFDEVAERTGDFAQAGCGVLITFNAEKKIDQAKLVLIGVDEDGPRRLGAVETMLTGKAPGDALFREAGAMAAAEPMAEDALVTQAYRQQIAGVLVRRCLTQAAGRAGGAA
ncbi:MAG: FAD binding domain-containing protein [Rhodospirillaceae bacterium]